MYEGYPLMKDFQSPQKMCLAGLAFILCLTLGQLYFWAYTAELVGIRSLVNIFILLGLAGLVSLGWV